ncbi:MAG: hypothetical protein AB8G23_23325 [Myxococcota bacterium]
MSPNRFFAGMAACLILMSAAPSAAWEWEGSEAERITATGLDAAFVRPLAAIRVVMGAMFFLPASVLASPSGREGITGAYDIFLAEPMEYVFKRELGEF